MLIFAASDKGGTGRSVTSSNVIYRSALQGNDVCYLDFDFGSPTSGAIFDLGSVERGTKVGGLHAYLRGITGAPQRVDIWEESDRRELRGRPAGAGRMVLMPGDIASGEFSHTAETVERCCNLFLRLDEEFDLCLVDLSAGRSHALELVLAATAHPSMEAVRSRWLIYHRWTRQHVIAASGLVYGERGILTTGEELGHSARELKNALRFVHTAVVNPDSVELAGLQPEQVAWLRICDAYLKDLAGQLRVGRSLLLGSIPLDPVLQWREQLISDSDVLMRGIANESTRAAFETLAKRIVDDSAWEPQ
ncbi:MULTISPECIES: SCO2523 family variant P-loop protein [Paractinoplanes]|uniref:SCO2523 family variant P-loop protein n=1 Tax=Paractinoplanes hotanensis TaxID=2906497 RepID=A0ABT0YDS8_9ACTN|nr:MULTISPECIES: SCO2523 family variant P-loop protein [Actinoplanes]MCM4084196.1 SCO2523 family variant P-loop protein [Actinoplanes hotanensis]